MPPAFTLRTAHPAELRGVIPPILLPMTEDGDLDSKSLDRSVGYMLDAGAQGLWVNGTTGEFYALDGERRARVVRECVRAAADRASVVAHVGDASTNLAVQHARAAVEAGADALSVLPPCFLGFEQEELKNHVRTVSEAVDRPVLAYHLPQYTPTSLSIDSLVELAGDGVVCGVKDSSSDVVWFRQLTRRLGEAGSPVTCLTGGSSVADMGYMLGAAGSVSSIGNLAPAHLVRQYHVAAEQDWAQVLELQKQTEDLIGLLRPPGVVLSPGMTAAVYKHLLTTLGVIDTATTATRTPLSAEVRTYLDHHAVPAIRRLEEESRAAV